MDKLQLLAIWLNGAAHDLNRERDFRKMIKCASVQAEEMYGTDGDDPMNVREVLAEFAQAVDQDTRDRKAGDS